MKKAWKISVSTAIAGIVTALPFTAFAAGEVGTDQLQSSIYSFGDYLIGFAVPVGLVALVIGLLALTGTQQAKQWAKAHIFWVIVAVVGIILAPSIIMAVQSMAQGAGA